jgi:hypothetical protein
MHRLLWQNDSRTRDWWPVGATLNLTVIPANDAYSGWVAAAAYFEQMKAANMPIVGLIGPPSSEAFLPVRCVVGVLVVAVAINILVPLA